MFHKLLITTLIIILFTVSPAFAEIQIKNLDTLPNKAIPENYILSPAQKDKYVQIKTVSAEVYHIQKIIPVLNDVDLTIYLVKKHAGIPETGLDDLYGYACDDLIYLFSYSDISDDLTRNVVAHEIGHVVRYYFIPQNSLNKYFKMRTKGENKEGYFNDPEELFAEDFVFLFGSESAKKIVYSPEYKPPGPAEKEWILGKINEDLSIPLFLVYLQSCTF